MDITALIKANAARWKAAQFTRPAKVQAQRILAGKFRYQQIEKETGVPWWVIGAIHYRECDLSWSLGLAQGEPWRLPSKGEPHTPAFTSWSEAAIYALTECPPYAAKWKDWSVGGALTLTELYNGEGYEPKPSPYVWAGTQLYTGGLYVADRKYDPNKVDQRLGTAALIRALQGIDPTVKFAASPPQQKATKAITAAGSTAIVAAAAHTAGAPWWLVIAAALIAGAGGYLIAHLSQGAKK